MKDSSGRAIPTATGLPPRSIFSGPQSPVPVRGYSLAGRGNDAPFQAAAMAVIDAVYSPFSLSSEVLGPILRTYSLCYPDLISDGLDTPAARLKAIFAQQPISQTVADLAMVLRQIAVTELCRNPVYYRLAFINSTGITTPERLRQTGTPLGRIGLEALAYALGLPVRVSVCTEDKELPASMEYNGQAAGPKKPELKIRLMEDAALAKVYPGRFDGYQDLVASPLNPGARFPSISMTDISALAAADEQLASVYLSTLKYLIAAYVAGELAYEALLAVYLSSATTPPATSLSGLETGSYDYFRRVLVEAAETTNGLPSYRKKQGDSPNTQSLFQAVARSVSLGEISESRLDDVIRPSRGPGIASPA